MNNPVSFEIAKLLTNKDYPLSNIGYGYNDKGNLTDPCFGFIECEAPFISDIVVWLYEKHGIWISVDKDRNNEFYYIIRSKNHDNEYDHFHSPTEAYEAAIDYTLKNLIK